MVTQKTSSNTKDGKIVAVRACEGVNRVDNPPSFVEGIQMLYNGQRIRNVLRPLLRLEDGGFDVLVKVAHRWIIEEKSSTVYSITANDRSVRTRVRIAVDRMIDKGLLQVIGTGRHSSRVFVPAKWVLDAVNDALSK